MVVPEPIRGAVEPLDKVIRAERVTIMFLPAGGAAAAAALERLEQTGLIIRREMAATAFNGLLVPALITAAAAAVAQLTLLAPPLAPAVPVVVHLALPAPARMDLQILAAVVQAQVIHTVVAGQRAARAAPA